MRTPRLAWLVAWCITLAACTVQAKALTYVLAIGNNAPPLHSDTTRIAPLRYADDDAASMCEWGNSFATESTLLSVMDAETQQRYPTLARRAQPPTLSALHQAIAHYRTLMTRDHAAGDTSTLIFYMSSHGSLATPEQPASLALLDAALTQEVLYNDILAQLPADHVHLFVDACHAEAVVRPRGGNDVSAQIVDVSPEDTRRWLENNTLARFPNVGAVIATSTDEESHEWSLYRGGVFTHQLLSGLRGAADVNGDRRIEYSEIHAFLGAANREIDNPRARLKVLTRAPPLDLRTPIADLREAQNVGWLVDLSSELQRFYIEDARGVRYVDANVEAGHSVLLALPASTTFYIHTASAEASFQLQPGHSLSGKTLALVPTSLASRDATLSSMERGLFATPYGPAYYRGFVDNAGEMSVDFISGHMPGDKVAEGRSALRWTPWVVTGAAVVSSGVFGGMMINSYHNYSNTDLQKQSRGIGQSYYNERTGLFVSLGVGVVAAAVGTIMELLNDDPAPITPP